MASNPFLADKDKYTKLGNKLSAKNIFHWDDAPTKKSKVDKRAEERKHRSVRIGRL